jgi:hypothetical protein
VKIEDGSVASRKGSRLPPCVSASSHLRYLHVDLILIFEFEHLWRLIPGNPESKVVVVASDSEHSATKGPI